MSLLAIFTQCASSQKIDNAAPVEVKGAYYQKWVAGIEGGGEGINIIIPLGEDSDIKLTEAFFQGKRIVLEKKSGEAVYFGKYTNPNSVKRDLIMSDDPKEEFKNKVPDAKDKIPFELNEKECVIGYTKAGKTGFFKIDSLPEKQMQAYPSRPRQ